MSGFAARLTRVSALAALALAFTTSSGAAASPARAPILGVVPHAPQLAHAPHLQSMAVRAAGPTMLTFDARYQNVINQYFADIARDSGGANNVYSVATQYYDNPGQVHIQYRTTVGGSYVARDPLPANGCDDGVDLYCLTDKQLQDEIQNVLTAKAWHGGNGNIFFLMTPNGVGSCVNAFGQCSTDTFCAYHSAFANSSNEATIYANEPYEGPYPGCTGAGAGPTETQGFPNDIDADTTVNTISHEHNEAITDPFGDGWLASDGATENGDLCAYGFGTQTGTGSSAYNQVINGHHYDLQQEYSNTDNGCIQHTGAPATAPTNGTGPLLYGGGAVMHTSTAYAIYWLPTARNTARPGILGDPFVNQTLKTSTGSWVSGGAPFVYQWQRCSATGAGCVDISGATGATYKLTSDDGGHLVRSTVRATNVNGLSPPAASTGSKTVVGVPAVTRAPHVSGRVRVGKKLSGSHGAWTYRPRYRYQWLRCNVHGRRCSNIRHATHATYKLTKHDVKHRLRLRVTAANPAGRAKATSAASARVGR